MAVKSSNSEVYHNPIEEKNEIEHFYFQKILKFFCGDKFLHNDNSAKEILPIDAGLSHFIFTPPQ